MTAETGTTLLPTRHSLLSRVRDSENHEGWREFFETYWRLIYRVARQAGLCDSEAQDVVQNTFIYLARRMPGFRYDTARGSFKSWLRCVTRSRISVLLRRAQFQEPPLPDSPLEDDDTPVWESVPDPAGGAMDETWQREWEANLVKTALRRISARVSAQQMMIFELAALGEVPLERVASRLEISLMQVYLARHRVGKLFKAEVLRLKRETE